MSVRFCSTLLLLVVACDASAATNYVWQDSPNPRPPYSSWETAAHVIQDAVDAADPGDTVLVTNGLYATGSRELNGNNRVAVDKPLTLISVNGADATIIEGYQVPGTTNGDGAIRCVYLAGGATVSGFTLTNGATRSLGGNSERNGGGVWCVSADSVVTNCILTGNSASRDGGGVLGGTLYNCVMEGNSAEDSGGGSYSGTLNNCTLTSNSAGVSGGGASGGTLNNCVLADNSAGDGGGTAFSTLNNCTLSGNSAGYGGGAYEGTLNNCTLSGNSAGPQTAP